MPGAGSCSRAGGQDGAVGACPGGGGVAACGPGGCDDALDGARDGYCLCGRQRGGGERGAPPVDAHWVRPMGLDWRVLECAVVRVSGPDGWVR